MSLFGAFRRPVGAAADVRELEYLSAIHQTSMPELRSDGTISATDVQLFLRSRYGVVVSDDDAIDIVKGLGGTIGKTPVVEKPENKCRHRKRKKKNPDIPASMPEHEPYNGENGLQSEPTEGQKSLFKSAMSSLKGGHNDIRRSWTLPLSSLKKKEEPEKEPPTTADMFRMDLVQMMSVLLIPTLIRANQVRVPPVAPPVQPPEETRWRRFLAETRRILTLPYTLCKNMVQRKTQAEKDALYPKVGLIGDVLRIMLASLRFNGDDDDEDETMTTSLRYEMWMNETLTAPSNGRDVFPELKCVTVSEQLVRKLLKQHGEHEAAADQELVKAMVDMVGGTGAVLDEKAFGNGLTLDVAQWPFECEDDLSTSFRDVYGFNEVECNKYASSPHPGLDTLTNQSDLEQVVSDIGNAASADTKSQTPRHEKSATDLEMAAEGATNIPNVRSTSSSMNSFHSAKSLISDESPSKPDDESPSRKEDMKSVSQQEAVRQGAIPKYKPNASFIDYASDNVSMLSYTPHIMISASVIRSHSCCPHHPWLTATFGAVCCCAFHLFYFGMRVHYGTRARIGY